MDTIPKCLIWRNIMPLIPAFGLTDRILIGHKHRIHVINTISAFCGPSSDEMRAIMDVARSFDFIDGGAFSYEAEGLCIYINHHEERPTVVMIMW